MLVVPKAIADKPQAMTFYNMMDYKPNALLGIIIAITMIIFNTLIILILLIIKTSLSTPCVRIITTKITTITIFAIKIKMSHPCLAYHHHHNPATYIYFHFDFENVLFPCNTHSFIHPSQMVGKKSYFLDNHFLQRIASQSASS